MIKVKAFIEALHLFSQDPLGARKFFNDKRISHAEKNILHALYDLRESQNDQVITNLTAMPSFGDELVEGVKHFILAGALNNKSEYSKALEHYHLAHPVFKKYQLQHYYFMTHFYLFIVYMNLGDKKNMKKVMLDLKKFPATTDRQKMCALRSQFLYAEAMNQKNVAKEALEEIDHLKPSMNESDLTSHLIGAFDFYFSVAEYEKCEKILDEFKRCKKFYLTESFNYTKVLFEHVTQNKPIYANEANFRDVPVLMWQISFLKSLEAQDNDLAHKAWSELHHIRPNVFAKFGEFLGGVCLFSKALEMHLTKFEQKPQSLKIVQGESIVDSLKMIFSQARGPIKKEDLFRQLWGKEDISKEDMVKLSRSIYRLKQKEKWEIKTRKGCYYLEKKAS